MINVNHSTLIKLSKGFAIFCSLIMFALFISFFIGEKISLPLLKGPDIALLIFIPGILSIGAITAWFKELTGGLIMTLSIVVFNIISTIAYKKFTFDFWLFLIIAILFITIGLVKTNEQKKALK